MSAAADAGSLAASALTDELTSFGCVLLTVSAGFNVGDLIIVGPPTPRTIDMSYSFTVSGFLDFGGGWSASSGFLSQVAAGQSNGDVGPFEATVLVNLSNIPVNAPLGIHGGASAIAGNSQAQSGPTSASIVFSLVNGFGVAGSAGVFDLPPGYTAHCPSLNIADNQWLGPALVPIVIEQPIDAVVCPGETATFSAAGFGVGTIVYQWRKDGVPLADGPTTGGSTIDGSQTSVLTIDGVAAEDAGAYDVLISFEDGELEAQSASAALELCPPPPADLNDDGRVDGADLGLLLGTWGDCPSCAADLNGDDVVDGADLGLLLGAWTG